MWRRSPIFRPGAKSGVALETLQTGTTHCGTDIVRQLLLFGRGRDSPRGQASVMLVIRELRRMMQEIFPKNSILLPPLP